MDIASQQTFNHSPMKKLIYASFVFSFVMLSGCQMLFGTSDDQSTSEPAVQTVQNDIPPQETDLKNVEPQSPDEQAPSQEIPKEEIAQNLPIPSGEQPTAEPNDTVDTVAAPVPPAPDNTQNEPQFNNPDELKQYIANNQETLKKNDLPPKNIKCHVHTENLNSKFFEFTNEYETKFSEKGLRESYCNEKTIQYYGSGEFDFECYEVKKDNETKVKNGFEVKLHLSCASKNIPGADGSTDIQIVNPFYDPNSKIKKAEEANVQAALEATAPEGPAKIRTIKCDIKAGDKTNGYQAMTNDPEMDITVDKLKLTYCKNVYIEAMGRVYDFDCYEVAGESGTKLPGGYTNKLHFECPEPNSKEAKELFNTEPPQPVDCEVDVENTERLFEKPNFSKKVTFTGYTPQTFDDARPEFTKEYCSIPNRNLDRFFIKCCFHKAKGMDGYQTCNPVSQQQVFCK